jgi:very-short-patch-repair endonuclease
MATDDFPIILIPPAIRRVKAELPPIPPFRDQAPRLPGTNVQVINLKGILIGIGAVFVAGAITINMSPFWGLTVIILGLIGVAIGAWVQSQSHPKRTQEYSYQMEQYYKNLEVYCQKEVEYQRTIAEIRSPQNLIAYQYPRLLQVLERTVAEDRDHPSASASAQLPFWSILNDYFPQKIHLNPALKSLDGLLNYQLDFAYIDPALNLRIDLEVDEPYEPLTGEAKHYQRSFTDQTWNEFLLSKGWIVIRFASQQVDEQPASCCKVIAQTLYDLLGDPSISEPFAGIADLQPLKHWTEAEARQMALQHF